MTTKFLDNKIRPFKKFIGVAFPTKSSVLDDFPLCPQGLPPSKSENVIFIVVSPSLSLGKEKREKIKLVVNFRFAASISLSLSTPVPIL